MATLVKEAKYILSNIGNNNNKFWYIELYDDCSTITRNGRVGASSQVHPKSHHSMSGAERFFDDKIREKERKGYTPLNVVGTLEQSNTRIQSNTGLAAIAKSQIKTNDSLVGQLIDYFTRVNAHNICSATGGQITFSNTTGMFSTPLGIVTQDNINDANRLLVHIGNLVASHDYGYTIEEATNKYMMLVPQDIGARRLSVRSFWSSLSAVQRQKAIVDSLQASLVQSMQTPVTVDTKDEVEQVFDVQLDLVSDPKVISKIKKQYDGSKNSMHDSSHLRVKTVYAVRIANERQSFESRGIKVGNVKKLWHGTRASNVLSILKGGLVIPSSSSSHCTGRMFGDGLYFSDQSTKSLNYAYGVTWGHGRADSNCFMFLCDVAMGKEFVPSGGFKGSSFKPPTGYDSTFAKAGQSGVRNNEQIVYKTHQANLVYLIEFSA